MAEGMIEGIRRMVGSAGKSDWDVNQLIEPETEADFESQEMEPTEVHTPSELRSEPPESDTDYYVNLVKASIDQNGKFGKQMIPVPWLRMTLAGLEGRPTRVEDMWTGPRSEEPAWENGPSAGLGRPPFEAIFNAGPGSSG